MKNAKPRNYVSKDSPCRNVGGSVQDFGVKISSFLRACVKAAAAAAAAAASYSVKRGAKRFACQVVFKFFRQSPLQQQE